MWIGPTCCATKAFWPRATAYCRNMLCWIGTPPVETLKSYLGIGESAYSARLKELLDAGYILREKRREANARFAHNLYTIARQPKRFRQEEGASISGILSAGYGMIPRAVMFDPRLDCKAKGLYAYLAAFTGAGRSAFPERN